VAVLVLCAAGGAEFEGDMAETAGAMRVWHASEGLPSDTVTALIQTRDGFLWVGTSAGLARFDGARFSQILSAAGTNTLTGVTALCEDRNGHIWIGTQQGGLFELAAGTIERYTGRPGLVRGAITSLAADGRGQVWIGGSEGLSLWTGDHFQLFTQRDGLPDDSVSSVDVAQSGTVWITTRVGMCRFVNGRIVPHPFQTESQGRSPEYLGAYEDQKGNLWAFGDTYLINLTENKRFNYFRTSEPASLRIWSLCEGRDGRLWIGTSGRGLFCFEDNRFQPVIFGEQRWPYDVRAICEDREGNVWLGTSGGGLAQLRPQSVHILRVEPGLADNPPAALALDGAGRLYTGLQRGGLFVGESDRFDRLNAGNTLGMEDFISSLCLGKDGTVWVGTLGDGLYGWRKGRSVRLGTADGLADACVLALASDRQGDVWASTRAGTVHRLSGADITQFDTANGLSGAPVTALAPAADGGLWLGTADGGILRQENGKFQNLAAARVAGAHPVRALFEGARQRLWIGTAGGGLACLANGAAWNWTTNNGLPSDLVVGLVEDSQTNLWLATGTGIYRVDHDDLASRLGNPQTPLSCKLVSTAKPVADGADLSGGPRAALAPDAHVWFTSAKGLVRAATRPASTDPTAFPVYIESVAINGKPPVSLLHAGPWSAPGKFRTALRTPLDLRGMVIEFTALCYAAGDELQFRHKLEGSDPDWVDDGGARFARYGNLPRGAYRFRVAARAAGGDWQESGETFAFVVPTPFYYQWWAITLYSAAAIALVAGVVRRIFNRRLRRRLERLEQQQALERERMRIARDMHDEMGSKLTKISFLSEHLQLDAQSPGPLASKVRSIALASRDLLQTMDEIVWVVNPHNDTLENLVAYLSHYAVEYFQNTAIECEMHLPAELPQRALSSEARHNLFLTFKEALNNVLKHSGASKVKIEVAMDAAACEFRISDNGRGFDAATTPAPGAQTRTGGGGAGLGNMRQRMANIGGEYLISGRPGEGTTVTLRLALNPESETVR
jgi:ligand-binding sensor domain-containing protein/signal transduction histidine kinase